MPKLRPLSLLISAALSAVFLAVASPADARPNGREWVSLGVIGGPNVCSEIWVREFRNNWQITSESVACPDAGASVSNPTIIFSDHQAMVPLSADGTQVLTVFGEPVTIRGTSRETGIGPVLVYRADDALVAELRYDGESMDLVDVRNTEFPDGALVPVTVDPGFLFPDLTPGVPQVALVPMTPDHTKIVGSVFAKTGSPYVQPSGKYDVGIIPLNEGQCPPGSESILFSMDDEDSHNISSIKGWSGGIHEYGSVGGTIITLCRVNGLDFHPINQADYVVVQLSDSCPPQSYTFDRLVINESWNNNDWYTCSSGPTSQFSNRTFFRFCDFPKDPMSSTPLPDYQLPYGVFGLPSPAWLDSGSVFTDDEDDDVDEYHWPAASAPYSASFIQIIESPTNRNTAMHTVFARNDKCTNQCPNEGAFDGANCYIGTPPAGTNAFIYANNFYYTPFPPPVRCAAGDYFDGANCFVRAVAPYDVPFVWSNNWYVEPKCR